MPDAGLLGRIRASCLPAPFMARGTARYGRGRARRATALLRLMRERGLLAPSRVGSPRGPRNHDGTILPETIDTMWGGACKRLRSAKLSGVAGGGADMTTTWTREGQVAVFIAVDHHSAECVGVHAARHGTRFDALEPIR